MRSANRYLLLAGSLVLVLLVSACGGGEEPVAEPDATASDEPSETEAAGPPESFEEILTYTGDDAEEFLYECAQEEGKVVYYTSASAAETALKPAFEEAYPGVELEIFRATTDLVPRLVEEETAGRHNFDVYGDIFGNIDRDDEFFAPFDSPHAAAVQPALRDDYFVATRGFIMSIGYNPDLVPADEVPQTWEDLLADEWTGEVWLGNDTSTPVTLGVLKHRLGMDFLEDLAEQVRVQEVSSRGMADQIIAGEIKLSMNVSSSYHQTDYLMEGAPFRWKPMSPMNAMYSADSISKNAPHPCAARLFMDWHLNPEGGLAIWTELGNASVLDGADLLPFEVEGEAAQAEWDPVFNTDPALIEEYDSYEAAVEDWNEIFRTLFVRN